MPNTIESLTAPLKTVLYRFKHLTAPSSISPSGELTLESALRMSLNIKFEPKAYKILKHTVNFIFRANNYFDVGLAAQHRNLKNSYNPSLDYVYAETYHAFTRAEEELLILLPEKENVLGVFTHNSRILVDYRLGKDPDPFIYRELDTAISAGLIFSLFSDHFSAKTGIELVKVDNIEKLKEVYSYFLISQMTVDDINDITNDSLKDVIGMQAIELIAACFDSRNAGEDPLLSLPGFSKEEANKAISHYRQIARACGFPFVITNLFPYLAEIHNLKAALTRRKRNSIEMDKIEHFPLKGIYLLREWLAGRNILQQVFDSSWPK